MTQISARLRGHVLFRGPGTYVRCGAHMEPEMQMRDERPEVTGNGTAISQSQWQAPGSEERQL